MCRTTSGGDRAAPTPPSQKRRAAPPILSWPRCGRPHRRPAERNLAPRLGAESSPGSREHTRGLLRTGSVGARRFIHHVLRRFAGVKAPAHLQPHHQQRIIAGRKTSPRRIHIPNLLVGQRKWPRARSARRSAQQCARCRDASHNPPCPRTNHHFAVPFITHSHLKWAQSHSKIATPTIEATRRPR